MHGIEIQFFLGYTINFILCPMFIRTVFDLLANNLFKAFTDNMFSYLFIDLKRNTHQQTIAKIATLHPVIYRFT
jgi:hypothetical protein